MAEAVAGPLSDADFERLAGVSARTALLASMLEGIIATQLQVLAQHAAPQAHVEQIETLRGEVERLSRRLAAYEQGPLLPTGAFTRLQRAQRQCDTLREDLRQLRERYLDSPDDDVTQLQACSTL